MNEEKKFDTVKMMREIRKNLNRKYQKNPESRIERLKALRKKYSIAEPEKIK